MLLDVALGAFGAHGLKVRLSADSLAIWETAARYHAYHALALFAVAWLATRDPHKFVFWAGCCFVGGIVIFSGSLYALAVTGMRKLGALTPLGGLLLMLGWLFLLLPARR